MADKWQILLVDDEQDLHDVTRLALKRKRLHDRRFNFVSAYSRKEAEKILTEDDGPFDAGLVDVVMETEHAGLDLCKFIRANCPRSFQIILRTGQPGVAPEDHVRSEYDIDYYLAKTEATADRLLEIFSECLSPEAAQD